MKNKLPFLLLFIHIFTFAQIKFEKAYFITNSDERVECFIKNMDWKNNPNSFEYRINESDDTNAISIKKVKLFEIYNQSKYVRSKVQIDQSSNDVNKLSDVRTPEFIEKDFFLKELASGNISLYKFTEGNLTRFFYKISDKDFEQLIYKPYEIEPNKIAYNDDYKKQLESQMNCTSINHQEIQKLQYKEKELTDLFIKYYKCSDPTYQEKLTKINKGKFNLYIRPRINSSSVEFSNSATKLNDKMENRIGFGIGLEAEYVLPFNRNKWAIIIEPTYQYYNSNKTISVNYLVGGQLITNVDYKSIELPIGVRHYLFINNDSKISISAQYVIDVAMDSSIEFKRNDGSIYNSIDVKTAPNLVIGLGYNYKNKYGIEARFSTNRNVTRDYLFWQSDYKNISVVLSYNLF